LQRTHAENLLVLHVGKCGLTLQSPQGLASKPGEEALAAEPQEDDSSGRCVPCLSGASAKSPPLLKEVLATCSLPLTFGGGALVKKMLSCVSGLLAGSLLLASTSGVLVKDPLAEECLVLVHPQIVDGRLSIPVCAVRTSASPMKNGPPTFRRQQSGSLFIRK
jgi:hypothetical protein